METQIKSNKVMEPKTIHQKNGATSKSHTSRGILWIVTACVLVLFFGSCRASQRAICSTNQIEGVWRLVALGVPENVETKKIITNGRFVLIMTIDNLVASSFGGTYTFDGETYTEFITFGTPNRVANIGRTGVLNVRFEGNRKYVQGLVDGGMRIPFSEVWERVDN